MHIATEHVGEKQFLQPLMSIKRENFILFYPTEVVDAARAGSHKKGALPLLNGIQKKESKDEKKFWWVPITDYATRVLSGYRNPQQLAFWKYKKALKCNQKVFSFPYCMVKKEENFLY